MRIVFMGTPEFAVPSLEHLVLNQYQVVAVYTQPDREAGRGRPLVSSPVKQAADALGLTVVQPVKLKDARVVAQLAAFEPDVIVVAAYGEILPLAVLDIPTHKCINIHPSLLPKYRGASPVAGAILAGDEFAGVSLMLMDAGLDTGAVLAQAQVAISRRDTTGSLTAKVALVAAQLLEEALPLWVAGELILRPQDEAEASYTAMLAKADGEIDWSRPALEISRRVRAFQPWPGCHTAWRGKQLKIIDAVPLTGGENGEVGQVLALDHEEAVLGVNTGSGILGLLQVQLEGKRAMLAEEFLRGQPQLIGAVLPSS